jgi:hypothetical protein
MNIIESLENRAIQYGFNHYVVNSIRHFKTTITGLIAVIAGVIAFLSAVSAALQFLLDAADGKVPFDIDHLNGLAAMFGGSITAISVGIGLISSKDHGTTDVAYDEKGRPIPRAEIVT